MTGMETTAVVPGKTRKALPQGKNEFIVAVVVLALLGDVEYHIATTKIRLRLSICVDYVWYCVHSLPKMLSRAVCFGGVEQRAEGRSPQHKGTGTQRREWMDFF